VGAGFAFAQPRHLAARRRQASVSRAVTASPHPHAYLPVPFFRAEGLGMRSEDPSTEAAIKEVAGLLVAAYQRRVKVVRLTISDKDGLDNKTPSSPHVVDGRRTER
jgi:hypothetical protein